MIKCLGLAMFAIVLVILWIFVVAGKALRDAELNRKDDRDAID